MEKEKMTMNVLVHKAKLTLAKGESVGDYTNRLSKACREHVKNKLNSTKADCWVAEVYANEAVVNVYDEGYYMIKYKVTKNGFEMGEMKQVERKTTFVPKGPTYVIKAEDVWETKKGMWSNIL